MKRRMPPSRSFYLALLAAGVLFAAPAFADSVTLKSGRTIEGEILQSGARLTIKTADGSTLAFSREDVQRVTLGNAPAAATNPAAEAASAADADFTRLQAQSRKADALADIIDAHEKFLVKYPDAPAAAKAKDALAAYKAMADQKFVKFHGQWMAPQKAEEIIRNADAKARPAVELYKAGKLRDALASADAALKIDEENIPALTIAGLVSYRLNDLPKAGKYFSKLGEVGPDEPLPWNNLAVIAYQQHREIDAVTLYTKAIQAAPGNQIVLDNVTEFIHVYKGATTTTPYKDMQRQYEQAEARLEARRAERGLFRYGSRWVTRDEHAKADAALAAIKQQMAAMEQQYTTAQATIQADEKQLAILTNQYNNMANDVLAYNAIINGVVNAVNTGTRVDPNTAINAQANRDTTIQNMEIIRQKIAALTTEKATLEAHVVQLKALAPKAKESLAKAQEQPYTGVQKIMDLGEADLPALTPPPSVPVPATQPITPTPATAPASPAASWNNLYGTPATTAPAAPSASVVTTPAPATPVAPAAIAVPPLPIAPPNPAVASATGTPSDGALPRSDNQPILPTTPPSVTDNIPGMPRLTTPGSFGGGTVTLPGGYGHIGHSSTGGGSAGGGSAKLPSSPLPNLPTGPRLTLPSSPTGFGAVALPTTPRLGMPIFTPTPSLPTIPRLGLPGSDPPPTQRRPTDPQPFVGIDPGPGIPIGPGIPAMPIYPDVPKMNPGSMKMDMGSMSVK